MRKREERRVVKKGQRSLCRWAVSCIIHPMAYYQAYMSFLLDTHISQTLPSWCIRWLSCCTLNDWCCKLQQWNPQAHHQDLGFEAIKLWLAMLKQGDGVNCKLINGKINITSRYLELLWWQASTHRPWVNRRRLSHHHQCWDGKLW